MTRPPVHEAAGGHSYGSGRNWHATASMMSAMRPRRRAYPTGCCSCATSVSAEHSLDRRSPEHYRRYRDDSGAVKVQRATTALLHLVRHILDIAHLAARIPLRLVTALEAEDDPQYRLRHNTQISGTQRSVRCDPATHRTVKAGACLLSRAAGRPARMALPPRR